MVYELRLCVRKFLLQKQFRTEVLHKKLSELEAVNKYKTPVVCLSMFLHWHAPHFELCNLSNRIVIWPS